MSNVMEKGLKNVVVMHAVTQVNQDSINEDPPGVDFELDDQDHMKTIIDNGKRGAYRFDKYRDLVQVSCLYQNAFMHFIHCPGESKLLDKPGSVTAVYPDEYSTMQGIASFFNTVHQETGGSVLRGSVFAGWQIKEKIWPVLVNRAFKYKLPMPLSLVTDPLRKFQTIEFLLDISSVYSQGAGYGSRTLPTLSDALTFWGYGERDKYPAMASIPEIVCANPERAADIAGIYLTDMRQVLIDYYTFNERI